ncbi:uracil-DNA glycosylase [Magnetococcus sp. PR-3]|uniref:uracil-DNA glycosylase n=1 Tax=Magnetococcus sp. PR-3 TaxID=3120355 RepID=UPI002FCE381B
MNPTAHDWIAALAYLEASGIPMLHGDLPTIEQIQNGWDAPPKRAWRAPVLQSDPSTPDVPPPSRQQMPDQDPPAFLKRQSSKSGAPPPAKTKTTPVEVDVPKPLELPDDKAAALEHIAQFCKSCERCDLAQTRTQAVPGVGSPHAPVVFVGEAPGADEDRLGEPFVGAAGHLLDKMISAVGFQRSDIYIANVIKCRPPGNRNPQTHEVALCQGYLHQQLEVIAPKAIFALGRFAIQSLLGSTDSVAAIRRRQNAWRGIPVVASYHPAFYLRTPARKKDGWMDLIRLKQLLNEPPA